MKCNCDGYSKGNMGISRARGVRDSRGALIEGYCVNLGRGYNNRAEVFAPWQGLKRLKEKNY